MPVAAFIPAIIAAGSSVAAAKIGSNAANKAAKTKEQADADALALQERMYNQDRVDLQQGRDDLAPYRGLGSGAAGLLGRGLGIDMSSLSAPSPLGSLAPTPSATLPTATPPPQSVPRAPVNAPPPQPQSPAWPMAALMPRGGPSPAQVQSQSSYVRMVNPRGQVVNVKPEDVQMAMQYGGRMA